jgi:hypothetical protein
MVTWNDAVRAFAAGETRIIISLLPSLSKYEK